MASDRGAVSRRMRPGAWDEHGFLGENEGLSERIDTDVETCAQLGTTPEALGKRLLRLLAQASAPNADPGDVEAGPGASHDQEPEPVVTIDRHPGGITCPWALELDEVCLGGPGGAPSADRFTITVDGESLEGLVLSVHLIANHRFFGGLDSRFRIDPARALAVVAVLVDE
jgi:hypothetical protein